MSEIIVKISSKGQIVIPAKYRKKWKTDKLLLKVKDNKIILEPCKEMAGIFNKYKNKAKNVKIIDLKEIFAGCKNEKKEKLCNNQ